MQIKDRIRGYLPVVIDIETGGFNDKTDACFKNHCELCLDNAKTLDTLSANAFCMILSKS
jgi:hypothetical protein